MGFLLLLYRITFVDQDFPSPHGYLGHLRDCQQVLRAKRLLTMSGYWHWQLGLGTLRYPRYPGGDGKS